MEEAHELKLREVKEEYQRKDEQGIPMSIRERYWDRMEELRERIRDKAHKKKLGQVLLEKRLVDDDQLKEALTEQTEGREDKLIGEVLVEKDLITEEQLEEALEEQLKENDREIPKNSESTK